VGLRRVGALDSAGWPGTLAPAGGAAVLLAVGPITAFGDAVFTNGFGVLLARPEVRVSALSEEHGVLDLSKTEWRPHIGERVRIVPNHVCVSANLHEQLLAYEGSGYRLLPLEARGRGLWSA